jgi:D-alanine-D-alanine ligase
MVALTGVLRDKIRAYTKTVYKRMNLRGVVRMDFLVSGGNAYLCEVNTVPGSLAYYLFCERLTDARLFLGDILEEAIFEAEKGKKKILHTGILKNIHKTKK